MTNTQPPYGVSPAIWRAVMAHDNEQAQVIALSRRMGIPVSAAQDLYYNRGNKPQATKDVAIPANERWLPVSRISAQSGLAAIQRRQERASECRELFDSGKSVMEIVAMKGWSDRLVLSYLNGA